MSNHITFMRTAIALAKEKEFAAIFLDLANRNRFVDPEEWAKEDHFVNTNWNCKFSRNALHGSDAGFC